MDNGSGFLVEDFVQSITSQLDRVQDVLRLKAQTRPLTYALKDFSLDLNVFVDMDEEGSVRLRASGPNETGASVVRLGFTTITKPMIEENTVELSMTTSPSLGELGLERDEERRLAQLGVRNAAQLQRLRQSTGTTTIARYTGVPLDRLRRAMRQGQPFVGSIQPDTPTTGEDGVETGQFPTFDPLQSPPQQTGPGTSRPPRAERPPGLEHPPGLDRPPRPERPRIPGGTPVRPRPINRPITVSPEPMRPPATRTPLPVAPGTRRLRLQGGNFINPSGPPIVHLSGEQLAVEVLDDDVAVVELPEEHQGGDLDIALPDGETMGFALNVEASLMAPEIYEASNGDTPQGPDALPDDPWLPQQGGTE